ncbi:hypothetical protein AMK11_15665 [Streptomyces sp. CB02414]|nr:hypothetical protein AMK11_15665 [Streptomyces sp. CB02414]
MTAGFQDVWETFFAQRFDTLGLSRSETVKQVRLRHTTVRARVRQKTSASRRTRADRPDSGVVLQTSAGCSRP